VARNRKRAKERRARRPPSADAGVAVARGARDEHTGAPPPMEHAAPDVELAEAQLALGRPDLAGDQTPDEIEALVEEEELEDELESNGGGIPGLFPDRPHVVSAADELEEFEDEPRPGAGGGRGGRRGGRTDQDLGGDGSEGGGELAPASAPAPAARALPGGRLINFLRGSWRELQRVQWPDRRQVVQATGVVIGFVIVAGLFLGGADWVAQKVVTFILK
jgi:preprotein translocase subunit SecE